MVKILDDSWIYDIKLQKVKIAYCLEEIRIFGIIEQNPLRNFSL